MIRRVLFFDDESGMPLLQPLLPNAVVAGIVVAWRMRVAPGAVAVENFRRPSMQTLDKVFIEFARDQLELNVAYGYLKSGRQ